MGISGSRLRTEAIFLGLLVLRQKYLNIGLHPARTNTPQEEPYLAAFDAVAPDHKPGDMCLEICAGLGNGGALAAGRGWAYQHFDQSYVGALTARLRGAPYVQGDLSAAPFGDNSIDHVIAIEGVVCLADPFAGMAEVFRILKPGATLTIVEFRLSAIAAAQSHVNDLANFVGGKVTRFDDLSERARDSILDGWPQRARTIRWVPWPFQGAMRDFLCLPGTPRYAQWENRERCYYLTQIQKPQD